MPATNMRIYMSERYYRKRSEALEFLGGKCVRCGSIEKLEVDHIDRTQKTFSISKIWNHRKEIFLSELKKCQLLCQKCHIEKTILEAGRVSARKTHGTLSSYRYCKCDKCRKANSEYMRELRHKRKLKLS